MNLPRLEIYLSKQGNLCISKVEKQNADARLIVDVSLAELKALGMEDATHRVGGTVLKILGLWHKRVFENWEVAVIETSPRNDDGYGSALRLIDQALLQKTSVHNTSIEYLLKQAATDNEQARKYLEEAWPLLRDRLGMP